MTATRSLIVHPERDALVGAVAHRLESTLRELLAEKTEVHVVLTGGSVGTDVLATLGDSPTGRDLDWSRMHVWWGDERWLPSGDDERNDKQADDALLGKVGLLPEHIHRFAADDGAISLDEAAVQYADELAAHASEGGATPEFDILLLGVGPDGHVASLFPDRAGVRERDASVVAVRESPKPPPERLSLTIPSIRRARRVWLALSGADKASALSLALSGANTVQVPVAGVYGTKETVFFVDSTAAEDVPPEVIANYGQ
ncbi:MAG: 6-phosphogluconolactonase [Cryobacterium sp.]|nr:6-phosphogluconolactonase [Cryobacterium sp.]